MLYKKSQSNKGDSKPRKLSKFLRSLPCLGIVKLVLTGICIILTVIISANNGDHPLPSSSAPGLLHQECLVFVTIYISFAMSGLLDIFIFYTAASGSSLLPKHVDGLILSCCFFIEMMLVDTIGSNTILMVSIISCLVMSLMKMMSNTSLLNTGLIMMTMIQGTWMIHFSLISLNSMAVSLSMMYVYFSWHVIAVFIINIIFNIIIHYITVSETSKISKDPSGLKSKSSSIPPRVSAATPSNPTGLTVTIKQESKLNKSMDNLSSEAFENPSDDNTSLASVPTQLMSMVDSDLQTERLSSLSPSSPLSPVSISSPSSGGVERVSPLEEFNTLHRHCQSEGVRRSIKLKESSIV